MTQLPDDADDQKGPPYFDPKVIIALYDYPDA